jgi:integrase
VKESSVSTRSRKSVPGKPRPDFPLSIHKGTGYWCKKVRGRVYYFGKVADDPKGKDALELWLDQKDDLLAGREPRAKLADALNVEALCFKFLEHKEQLRDSGELNPRTYAGYYAACKTLAAVIGRRRLVTDVSPDDFRKLRAHFSKTRGVVALRNSMQAIRSIFKFAFDEGLIVAPVRYGQAFAKPKLDAVRAARNAHRLEHGDRMFEAAEIRMMLDGATMTNDKGATVNIAGAAQPLRAMILIAANCAFGQTDLSSLPTRAVDLEKGWIDFPRPKTAVARKCPLWPETIAAIRDWLPQRPKAKDPADSGLLFLTVRGARWVKSSQKGSPKDAVLQEFGKLMRRLGLKRSRVAFYALRHGFETIAGETADQVAVDAIMGHVPQGMAGAYRERIGDDRLRRVAEHVRGWLFSKPTGTPNGKTDDPSTSRTESDSCAPCDPHEPERERIREIDDFGGIKEGRTVLQRIASGDGHRVEGAHGSEESMSILGDHPRLRIVGYDKTRVGG